MIYSRIPIGYAADVMTVGERIAEIRRALRPRLKQGDLAEIMGVAQSAVSKWENGETTPSASQLPKIATTLRCSVEDLVVGVDATYDRLRSKCRDLPGHTGDQTSDLTEGRSDATTPAASARLQQLEQRIREKDDLIARLEEAARGLVRLFATAPKSRRAAPGESGRGRTGRKVG